VAPPVSKYLIYALVDPRSGQWRYIGKSRSGLDAPKQHAHTSVLVENGNPPKCDWIRQLSEQGLRYRIEVLEELSDAEGLDEAEEEWVAASRRAGMDLINDPDKGASLTRAYKSRHTLNLLEKKRQFVASLKTGPCTDCGETYEPFAMEFDHLSPDGKVDSLAGMVARHATEDRILAEAAKCELVCVLCHRLRTERRSLEQPRSTSRQALRRREGLKFIRSLKTGPCVDCGKHRQPCQLDFDHRAGETKHYSVSKMTNLLPATVMAEVAKCDLVCALCHRIRTHERKQYRHDESNGAHAAIRRNAGPSRRVSDEQIDEMVSRYLAGETAPQIARAFEISNPSVFNRLKQRGITMRSGGPTRKLSEESELTAVGLYLSGLSAQKAAEKLGVSDSVIYEALQRRGVPRRSKSDVMLGNTHRRGKSSSAEPRAPQSEAQKRRREEIRSAA